MVKELKSSTIEGRPFSSFFFFGSWWGRDFSFPRFGWVEGVGWRWGPFLFPCFEVGFEAPFMWGFGFELPWVKPFWINIVIYFIIENRWMDDTCSNKFLKSSHKQTWAIMWMCMNEINYSLKHSTKQTHKHPTR